MTERPPGNATPRSPETARLFSGNGRNAAEFPRPGMFALPAELGGKYVVYGKYRPATNSHSCS
jgi:hypothetical protein